MQKILSVGIDVGTSTTQVIFSELAMENAAGFFSVPKISIVDKRVIYKSNVHRTPLKTDVLIDADQLKEIVAAEYRKAGVVPADVTSGAVIITGESARKENSDAVLHSLSGFAGDFVVAAAGPDMESLISGKGSGAWQYSMKEHLRVANLDIGGGTTNVVVFDDGAVIARGCLDIGGRLICVDENGRITKASEAAGRVARSEHISLETGQWASERDLRRITEKMAKILEAYLGLGDRGSVEEEIRTPGSSRFPEIPKLDAICFSGGVANFVYNESADIWQYGDIGVLLGQAVRQSRLCREFRMMDPGETIRATVVGAGTYTTSISGSTISYSEDIFPLKNIPVVKLDEKLQNDCFEGRPLAIREKIRWYQEQNDAEQFILAMPGKRNPGYEELKTAAKTIRDVMESVLPKESPMLLVIESDIAKAMGQIIRQLPEFHRKLVAIDSIRVEDGEYVDMGKPLMNGMVIPVVVKTLILG